MRYVVLIAYDPEIWTSADEATRQAYFDAHGEFARFVDAHGRQLSSAPLCGAETATTVHPGDGERAVTDGPFVELTEQIAGYYDVELPDLDTAIAAAKLLPKPFTVEVRPTENLE